MEEEELRRLEEEEARLGGSPNSIPALFVDDTDQVHYIYFYIFGTPKQFRNILLLLADHGYYCLLSEFLICISVKLLVPSLTSFMSGVCGGDIRGRGA